MFSWRTLLDVMFPGPDYPEVKNLTGIENGQFPHEGLVRGNLYMGEPGSGKTYDLAGYLLDYRLKHMDEGMFIEDWSGSLKKALFSFILQEPRQVREEVLRNTIYECMGHPKWVLPRPEFSTRYGGSFAEQVERVRENWIRLAPVLTSEAPFLAGLAINVLGRALFQILSGIRNERGETWQITELSRLLNNPKLIREAFGEYADNISTRTKEVITNRFLETQKRESELRTYALEDFCLTFDHPYVRARLGYPEPAFSAEDAIKQGKLVIIDGSRMLGQEKALHYLFSQDFSLFMDVINKRQPDDPADKPFTMVFDELYTIMEIPGMADQIAKIAPIYRSRKIQLFVVIQALWQLEKTDLKDQIWSLGNVKSYRLQHKGEAETFSYQLFNYNPKAVKLPPVTDTQNPVSEPEHGQDRSLADWITEIPNRHFVMRRYLSQSVKDGFIYYGKSRDLPPLLPDRVINEATEQLLSRDGERLDYALDVVDNRILKKERPSI